MVTWVSAAGHVDFGDPSDRAAIRAKNEKKCRNVYQVNIQPCQEVVESSP